MNGQQSAGIPTSGFGSQGQSFYPGQPAQPGNGTGLVQPPTQGQPGTPRPRWSSGPNGSNQGQAPASFSQDQTPFSKNG